MNTPKHQRDTTDVPSRVSPASTSDTPIYDVLVHETYGDQSGPLVDQRPPLTAPAQPPHVRFDTAEALRQALDGRVSGELPTSALGAPVSRDGQVPSAVGQPDVSGELPKRVPEGRRKRVPGTHMHPGIPRHGGRHHRPQVPDARQPDSERFTWLAPAEAAVCGGDR